MMTSGSNLYMVNPDVSCREEGPDGALLFNPDSDQILVINPTGLVIWQALDRPRRLDEVAAILVEQCNNVPEEEVHQDVSEFVEQLLAKGFVGICQETAA